MGQELATGQCIGQGFTDPLSVHCAQYPAPGNCICAYAGAGTIVHMLSLLCFVVGGGFGWFASRKGGRIETAWPVVLRTQILLTSAPLSLVAAWRLTTLGEVVGPLVLAGALWILLVVGDGDTGSAQHG